MCVPANAQLEQMLFLPLALDCGLWSIFPRPDIRYKYNTFRIVINAELIILYIIYICKYV